MTGVCTALRHRHVANCTFYYLDASLQQVTSSLLALSSYIKSVNITLDATWHLQTCSKLSKQPASHLWIKSLERGLYRGIFEIRDQIISFTEKRDFKKIFFVIRDTHISRDTWRASKQNLNIHDSWCFNFSACEPWQRPPVRPSREWQSISISWLLTTYHQAKASYANTSWYLILISVIKTAKQACSTLAIICTFLHGSVGVNKNYSYCCPCLPRFFCQGYSLPIVSQTSLR